MTMQKSADPDDLMTASDAGRIIGFPADLALARRRAGMKRSATGRNP